ncbi:MAG: hypothetical protein AMXMBFR80_00940 [Dehalococcoidia bacterium]
MGGFILVRRARPEVVPGAWLAPWQPGRRALEDSVLLAHAPPGDAGAGVLAPRRGLDVIDDARFREVEEGTGGSTTAGRLRPAASHRGATGEAADLAGCGRLDLGSGEPRGL